MHGNVGLTILFPFVSDGWRISCTTVFKFLKYSKFFLNWNAAYSNCILFVDFIVASSAWRKQKLTKGHHFGSNSSGRWWDKFEQMAWPFEHGHGGFSIYRFCIPFFYRLTCFVWKICWIVCNVHVCDPTGRCGWFHKFKIKDLLPKSMNEIFENLNSSTTVNWNSHAFDENSHYLEGQLFKFWSPIKMINIKIKRPVNVAI